MQSFSSLKLKPGIACLCLTLGAFAETIDINATIQRLGSKSYDERETATRTLWSAGKSAEAALNRALRDKDLEIRVRARFILDRLKLGLSPDSTPEEVAFVQQFRYGNTHEKNQILREIIRKGAKNQDKIPEWIESAPSNEKPTLLRYFEHAVRESLTLFITQNKKEQTHNLLELCLNSGHPPVAHHAAAYYLLKDELPAKITELKKSKSSRSRRALTMMYRAANEMEKARDAAKDSGDHRLLRDILVEMSEWNALADLNDVMKVSNSINDDRLMKMFFNWMDGRTEAFEKDCDWLEEQIKSLPEMNNRVWYAAEAFLITSQIERAEELLTKKKNFLRAMEIRFAAHDLKGAFELYEKGLGTKSSHLLRHQLTGARLYALAGKRKKAEELFNALANKVKKPYSTMYQIVGMEVKAGLRSLAFTHMAKAIASMRSTHQRRVLFMHLWKGREAEAEEWWNLLKKISPKDSPNLTLNKMDHLLVPRADREKPAVVLKDLVVSFEKVKDKNKARQANQHYAIGRAFAGNAMPVQASKHMEAAIKLYPSHSNALLYSARAAAQKPDWAAAAGYLARVQRSRSPHYEYLYGYALGHSGKADEGKKLMEKAELLLLGDELKRNLLITELRRFGLEEEARGQEDIIVRTGQFMSQYIGQVLRSRAEAALDKGDYRTAARYWERAMVRPVKQLHSFVETNGYLLVPQYVHTYWACYLAKEGKIDQAMERADLCFNFHPGGIDLAIHLVPVLESAGKKEEADRVFNRTFTSLRTLLESYPDSAQFRNQAAWMAAKCKRELDTALADSTHAVKLRPDSAAYIDTLAEVQFVLGRTDEAIKSIQRALQIEPDKDYYQKQLKRFKKAKDK